MKNLTLTQSNPAFLAGILRGLMVITGLMLVFSCYPSLTGGGTFWSGFVFMIGISLIGAAVFNITIGNTKKLALTNDFLRIEESGSYIRTAYWNSINELRISRYSMRITYKSGAPERFPLPLLNNHDHQEVVRWAREKSNAHDLQFSRTPWWKLF